MERARQTVPPETSSSPVVRHVIHDINSHSTSTKIKQLHDEYRRMMKGNPCYATVKEIYLFELFYSTKKCLI